MPLIRFIIISLIIHAISFAGINFYLNRQKIDKKENISNNKNMELIWVGKKANSEGKLDQHIFKVEKNYASLKSNKNEKLSPTFTLPFNEEKLDRDGLLEKNLNSPEEAENNTVSLNIPQETFQLSKESYDRIVEQIRSKIVQAKRYPLLARKRGIQGSSIIKFKLAENGNIDDIEILKSAGHEILDTESIETVKRASPFPYLPGWLEVPIEYRLE